MKLLILMTLLLGACKTARKVPDIRPVNECNTECGPVCVDGGPVFNLNRCANPTGVKS